MARGAFVEGLRLVGWSRLEGSRNASVPGCRTFEAGQIAQVLWNSHYYLFERLRCIANRLADSSNPHPNRSSLLLSRFEITNSHPVHFFELLIELVRPRAGKNTFSGHAFENFWAASPGFCERRIFRRNFIAPHQFKGAVLHRG